jgi:tetratricopeptide (TPR) repeat protein
VEVLAPGLQTAADPPRAEDVLAQLERIFANGDFDVSPRSRAFLRFVVEETLAGRQEDLTQSLIATRVCGRRDDFDPGEDPIVRIQAGRLRRSLERYYLIAGTQDPVHIEIPRGSYAPRWTWRIPGLTEAVPETSTTDLGDGWPVVTVGPFESADAVGDATSSFLDRLAAELGRYRDVRVVLRTEAGAHPAGPAFALSGRLWSRDAATHLTARLVNGRTGNLLWSGEYRSGLSDDTACVIAASVASERGAIARELWAEQRRHPPAQPTTYGAILESYAFFLHRDPRAFAPAIEALRRAVTRDPDSSLAWLQLSRLCAANVAFEIAPLKTPIDQAVTCALEATRLDPSSIRAQSALAFALLVKGELAAGLAAARAGLAANPGSLAYQESIGWLLGLLGDWEHGAALVRQALARNPEALSVSFLALCVDHLRRGEYDESYQAALQYNDAGYFWRALARACSLGHLRRLAEARREVAELLAQKPDFGARGRILISRLIKPADLQARIAEGLARAGLRLD